ncbi:P-loop NTPase family protein [Bacteroides faecichinchillae]|nr:hypothetical protein [Bacteroides faecichinchillae]
METIRTIREVIPVMELSPQESNQYHSVKFHAKGNEIAWNENQIEYFWKKEFINSMKEVEPRFTIDERNKVLLSELYNYVWERSKLLDSSKGLLLWGPLGVGKSVLIKGLQRYLGKINRFRYGCNNDKIGFKFTSAVEISLLYAEKGMNGISQFTDRECMCNLAIDELGREPSDSKHYGTGINVVQTILQLRYEVRRDFVTHVTTNIEPNVAFGNKYGDYIADRVKEMFNVVEIKGDSRR